MENGRCSCGRMVRVRMTGCDSGDGGGVVAIFIIIIII